MMDILDKLNSDFSPDELNGILDSASDEIKSLRAQLSKPQPTSQAQNIAISAHIDEAIAQLQAVQTIIAESHIE